MHLTHTLPIFIDDESKVLILGSFSSVKSRELGFYYSHKRNRFFSSLATIFKEECPNSVSDRQEFLRKHCIALYDVIYECDIANSSDSSIRNVVPIPISDILSRYPHITVIGVTGNKACSLFNKYLKPYISESIRIVYLPSTSPANARMSDEELVDHFSVLFK